MLPRAMHRLMHSRKMPVFPYLPIIIWRGMTKVMLGATDDDAQSMVDPTDVTMNRARIQRHARRRVDLLLCRRSLLNLLSALSNFELSTWNMKLCSIGILLATLCAFAHDALAQMNLDTAANVAANAARAAVNNLTEGPKAAAGRVNKSENLVKVIKDVANDRIEILIKPREVVAGADQKIESHVRTVLPKKLGQTIEISRLEEKLSKEAPIVLSETAQDVLETGKVGNVIGVPLADGARQAVELYQNRAKPIPAEIRFYLTDVF